jgi:repressor of nif and glnA expression
LAESVPIIDCDRCLELLRYLNEHKEGVELQKLDGFMRTKGVTTTVYHLKRHLNPKDLVTLLEKGTFRKMRYVKITENGVKALSKTLNKE